MRILIIIILSVSFLYTNKSKAQTENTFSTKWDNAYKVTSADKQYKLKFGGRIMWDNAIIFQDDILENQFGNIENGTEFRRIRLYNSGKIYNNIGYKVQLDFAGAKVVFKDVFINFGKIPVIGNIKVGHFKEPFRLESLTSSNYISFMERSFTDNMMRARNNGLMVHNSFMNKKLSIQVGIFRNGDKGGNDKVANDGYALTSRITGLIWNNKEKNQILHLGMAYSHRKPSTEKYSISARPTSHLAPKYVSTPTFIDIEGNIIPVDNVDLINFELALVLNSLSFQGEYTTATIDYGNFDQTYSSFYFMSSYMLTGEKRPYKNSYAGFTRVKPKNSFGKDGGIGAWELALRYSSINLGKENLPGDQLNDITLGVNWYMNPATRIMLNFVIADLVDVGKTNILQTRVQLNF